MEFRFSLITGAWSRVQRLANVGGALAFEAARLLSNFANADVGAAGASLALVVTANRMKRLPRLRDYRGIEGTE